MTALSRKTINETEGSWDSRLKTVSTKLEKDVRNFFKTILLSSLLIADPDNITLVIQYTVWWKRATSEYLCETCDNVVRIIQKLGKSLEDVVAYTIFF